METEVEAVVVMARAAYMTKTARAMIATKDTVLAETGVVHLLPGYGLSFPSASAAFVSEHASPFSGGVVCVTKVIWINNSKEVESLTALTEEDSKETKETSQSHKSLSQEVLSKDKDR